MLAYSIDDKLQAKAANIHIPTILIDFEAQILIWSDRSPSELPSPLISSVGVALQSVLVLHTLTCLLPNCCRFLVAWQLLLTDMMHRVAINEVKE